MIGPGLTFDPRAQGCAESSRDISKLRMLLALNHGCGCIDMYTDDGELSCPHCRVDFKRDAVVVIEEKFAALAAARMKEFAESPEGKEWIAQNHETISDGFGSTFPAWCSACKTKSMRIVRPGDVWCENCDSEVRS